MASIGVITVFIMENMAATRPNIMAIETDSMVNSHRANDIRFGLRNISCFTVQTKKKNEKNN